MRFVIFCEGGAGKGYGHFARCSALGAALREQGHAVSIFVDGSIEPGSFFSGMDLAMLAWPADATLCSSVVDGASACVFDSYQASQTFYSAVCDGADFLSVFFDDTARIEYPCGVVINGAPRAAVLYNDTQAPGRQYLLGVGHQVMRRAFWDCPPRPVRSEAHRVLVMLGADDIRGLMPAVYGALRAACEDLQLVFVSTRKSRTSEEMARLVEPPHELILDAGDVSICEQMYEADVAISAGGQTSYEMARCGLPAVMIQVADNQRVILESWSELGIARHILAWDDPELPRKLIDAIRSELSPALRREHAARTQRLVDGQGARRVRDYLVERSRPR